MAAKLCKMVYDVKWCGARNYVSNANHLHKITLREQREPFT